MTEATLTSGRKTICTEVSQRQVHTVLSTLKSDFFIVMSLKGHITTEMNITTRATKTTNSLAF